MDVESKKLMDVESNKAKSTGAIADPHSQKRRRRRRNICLAVVAVVVALAVLFVILGLTVFKVKRPVTTVNSTSLEDFNVSLDLPRLRVAINLTLAVDLSIKNPNKIGVKYTNSFALMRYRDEVVGEVPIPAGRIRADRTTHMNLRLTLLADRLLSNPTLYSDVASGTLPITSSTRISGKARILFFNIHVVSYTTCDINISVANRNVTDQTCRYRTKL